MLKFASLKSDIELPFYAALASHKINHDKLNDAPRRILGFYELRSTDEPSNSCRIQLHGNSLTGDDVPAGFFRAEGMIRNMNTIEDYRSLDMMAILNQAGRTIWEAINDGTIYSCPSLLASLTMLCFADLKRYNFTYVCGFPALHSESPWFLSDFKSTSDSSMRLESMETVALVDSVQTWRYSVDSRQYGFFLAKRDRENPNERISQDAETLDAPPTPTNDLGFKWVVDSLSAFEDSFFDRVSEQDQFICFADPSTHPQYPAWMLRNLLVLVRKRWKLRNAQILCYRDTPARRHEPRSIILQIKTEDVTTTSKADHVPKVTGWERNVSGKITSRITKLGEYLDPQRLADQAVDLNLKLIKWRIAPNLNLDVIKDTKCLLLGAGTLGSYVARNLMGWGVRHITFVDNGKVSFSNPVRQPLFGFQDCLEGGKPKAIRAAEALREIYPGVNATGHVFSVPMAGHPIIDEPKVRKEFEDLESLINEHDVTFLLMDTRESRWLPTVIGKTAGKLVMNAALGFDTFVVLRHGIQRRSSEERELGCYFCNDVVAPADSLSDRTLDQQCTVTRPGVAAIASALLVELMVSVLQHKDGIRALASFPGESFSEDGEHPLGNVPHQVRGFLSSFSNTVVTGRSYDCCSACSPPITQAYSSHGWEFVKTALNEKGYVEEISGLAEVQRAAEKALLDVEWDSDEQEAGDSEAELL